ncbi:MAG: DNA-binding protein [Oscillospiraceae bacterium]|nr:DNA-binding protein [Oscillospiraceae bacterium]MBQ5749086.1 DNA-binding protein [Oscillospiraceae bacterium]
MSTLGFDTSNYTTSAAVFDGVSGRNCSRLLDVRPGELGLRQSDALFAHVKRLPEMVEALFAEAERTPITAVGASTRPRAVEGSYMPCFLAGESQARNIARVLDVPFYAFSHQQGHIAAALFSANRLDLMQVPHLAWHLSGGTTELLLVTPTDKNVCAERIGGTSDISAGQVIDRTGKLLGLDFPAGKAIDALCGAADTKDSFRVKLNGLEFSLSGLENKIMQYRDAGHDQEQTARYAMQSVCLAVSAATREALRQYPDMPVVFSGGVASNSMLRRRCAEFGAIFAQPQFSTDNAMGIAVLTWMQEGH